MATGEIGADLNVDDHHRFGGVQLLGRKQFHLAPRSIETAGPSITGTGLQLTSAGSPGNGPAVHGVDLFKAELPVPRSNERGPSLAIAREDHRAVLDHQNIIRTLHNLSAGEPAETGDVPGGVFLGGAHIDEVAGLFFPVVQHRLHCVHAQIANAIFFGQPGSVIFCGS